MLLYPIRAQEDDSHRLEAIRRDAEQDRTLARLWACAENHS
ncbi:hypothetical protein [Erwinia persicina]|nr:hypothetical protein [Erwinia persicina]